MLMQTFRQKELLLLSIVLLVVALVAGCGGPKQDPILQLSAEESLEIGKELMEKKKYSQAREYLSHAFEVAPNSAVGREALLLVADAHYLDGGSDNFIRAEAKYRDFLNRFPTSERAGYVQLQLANSLSKRMLRPDRDQTATRQALEAYDELLLIYPGTQYAEEGRLEMAALRENLADHEMIIGRYNFRRRLYTAATSRLSYLVEEFPEYSKMDRALYYLVVASYYANQPEEGKAALERLETEYPDSPYLKDVNKRAEKAQRKVDQLKKKMEKRAAK
ncbi:MAG: outer membrane protein assembly factor BamD [Acidobacteria bacterium]|nr:MAG: outer membrane protein assembly factor BamD [Acidobacteriota bacterium]